MVTSDHWDYRMIAVKFTLELTTITGTQVALVMRSENGKEGQSDLVREVTTILQLYMLQHTANKQNTVRLFRDFSGMVLKLILKITGW